VVAVRVVRGVLRHPRDVPLALRVGWFLFRAPVELDSQDLRAFLGRLHDAPRPRATDLCQGMQRVVRVRRAWLSLPLLRRRDTCYLRALTLYRFLDGHGRHVMLHFGVEPPRAPGERLHGHAWVTVDGELLEGPPDTDLARVVEVNLNGAS
jgi:Transglutaminase-like superfamily